MNLKNHDLDIILFTKITSNFENNHNYVFDDDNHDHIDEDNHGDGDVMI